MEEQLEVIDELGFWGARADVWSIRPNRRVRTVPQMIRRTVRDPDVAIASRLPDGASGSSGVDYYRRSTATT
jgi:hypothetical protein